MSPSPVLNWIPLAALAAVGLSTALAAYGLYRDQGIKAIVLASTDDAHGYLTNVFKAALLAGSGLCVILAAWPRIVSELGPITWLENPALALLGAASMAAGSLLVILAQLNMGMSWRVGIDRRHRTTLVTVGIYRVSRNPIYLGMLALVGGLFLVVPNAATLALLGISAVAVPTQIHLEEEFLERLHGADFAAYRARTRRWF